MILDEEAEKEKTWTIWERLWWCREGKWSRCRRSWEKPTQCIVHTWKSSDVNIYCISHGWDEYLLFKLAFSGLIQSIRAILHCSVGLFWFYLTYHSKFRLLLIALRLVMYYWFDTPLSGAMFWKKESKDLKSDNMNSDG